MDYHSTDIKSGQYAAIATKRHNAAQAAAAFVYAQPRRQPPGADPYGETLLKLRAAREAETGVHEEHEPRPVRVYPITEPPPETGLRCDPELARIAVALHLAALLRLWIILREMTRQTGHMAFTRAAIRDILQSRNIPVSDRHFIRWLHRGHTVFWNIDSGANLIYPTSPVLVAQRLIEICKSHGLYDLYITNHPGQRKDMYIQVDDCLTRDFERRVYEAWMCSRNNPSLSRWTLERLWNRRATSLRQLEQGSRLQKVTNYAFCDLAYAEYVPLDETGKRRKDVKPVTIDGRRCWQWQISNTYIAPSTRQHHKRGVTRRVLFTIKHEYPEIQATGASDAETESLGSLNRTYRMFYDNHEKARANAAKYGEMIRYSLLGYDDGNCGLFEVTPMGEETIGYWDAAATLRRRGVGKRQCSALCDRVMSPPPF